MQGFEPKRPPFGLSLAVCAILTAGFVYLRLAADKNAGPALGLAILVCLWNRERMLLWGMTAVFTVTVFVRILWFTPVEIATIEPASQQSWTKVLYIVYMLMNVWVISVVVHLFIGLHDRLERRNATLEIANAYLESTNKELLDREKTISQQNSEIAAKEKRIASMERELEARGAK